MKFMLQTNAKFNLINATIEGFQASLQKIENQWRELLKANTENKRSYEQAIEILPRDAIEEKKEKDENMVVEKYNKAKEPELITVGKTAYLDVGQPNKYKRKILEIEENDVGRRLKSSKDSLMLSLHNSQHKLFP